MKKLFITAMIVARDVRHQVPGIHKHFPGHGDTKADTHYGYASTQKTWDEMLNCEMIRNEQITI